MASTEISPLYAQGRLALRDGTKTLREVASDLLDPLPPEEPSTDVIPFPAVPRPLVLEEKHRKALALLPKVFGKVVVDKRRRLTSDEIATLHEERETVKTVMGVLEGRADAIAENIRHHVDVQAEKDGLADPETTLRDAQGHYILARPQNPTRVNIPGTNEAFSLEYRSGSTGTASVDNNLLLDLYESGKISREEYLAVTAERRVFDEEKATKAVIKNPALLDVIKQATVRSRPGKPGTSLFVRKAK